MKKIIFSILGILLFSTISLCFFLPPKSSSEIQVIPNDITEDYLIESYDDLCQLAQLVNDGNTFEGCCLQQTVDIYISYGEAQNFVSIGYASPVDESGVYDYSGYSFRGIYSALDQYGVRHKIVIENALDAGKSSATDGISHFGEVCIFGSIYNAVITDVEVVGGTLVGAAIGSVIKDCKVETFGYTYAHKLPNYYAVGGIAAYASNCLIQYCMNSSDSCVAYWEDEALSDSDRMTAVGGIVGLAAGGVILRCNNYGSVVGYGIVGGIVGCASGALLSQCCGAIDEITINEETLFEYDIGTESNLAAGKLIIGDIVGGIAGVVNGGDNDLMVWDDTFNDYVSWTIGDGSYTIDNSSSAPFYDSLYPSADSSSATIDQCYNMTNIMYIGGSAYGDMIHCGGVVGAIYDASIYGTYNLGTIFCDSSSASSWIESVFYTAGSTESVENRYNFLRSINYSSGTYVSVGGIFGWASECKIVGCFNMGKLYQSDSSWYDDENYIDVLGAGEYIDCISFYHFYYQGTGYTFPNNLNYCSDEVSYYNYSDIIDTVDSCLSGERWVIRDEYCCRIPFLDWQVQTVFYESSYSDSIDLPIGKTAAPFEEQFSIWLAMIRYYYSDFGQRIHYEEVYDTYDSSSKVLTAVDLVYGDKYQFLPIPDNLVDDEVWYFDSWRLTHIVMGEDPWSLAYFGDPYLNMAITQDTTIKFYCPQDTGYSSDLSSAIIIRQFWDNGETYGSEDNYTRIAFFDGGDNTIDASKEGGYLTGYGDAGYAVKFIGNNETLGELPTIGGIDFNWYYETSKLTLYATNERAIITNLDEYLYRSIESSSSDKYAVFKPELAFYTISFDANGGVGTVSSVSSTYSSSITLPDNSFTRTGFTANGWNTSATLTPTPTYSNGSSYDISGDATLYANWAPKAKNVTLGFKFNENGSWDTTARNGFAYRVSYATTTIASNSTTSSTQRISSATTLTMRAGQTISIVNDSSTQGWICMGYVIGSASPPETVSSEFTRGTYALADNTTSVTIYLCFKYVGATLKYDAQLKYFYFEDGMFPQTAVSSYDAAFNTHLTNVADYSEFFVSNETTFYLHTYYAESVDSDEFMAYENQKFLGFIMPTTRTVVLQDPTASSVTYASYTFTAGTTYWFRFEPIRWRVSAYGVSESDIPSTWSSGELVNSVSLASDVLWWDAVNDSENNPLAVGNSATETTFMSTLSNGEFMGGISWECWHSEDSSNIDCDQFTDSTQNAKVINSSVTWTGGEPRLASQAEIETYMSDKRSCASALVCVLAGENQNQFVEYWTRDFGQQIGCGTYITSSGVVIKNSYWDTKKGIRFSCTMAGASYVGFL